MGVRILLADDHKIMRDGLRALLEKEPGMELVAEAGDGRTAVRLAHEFSPDLVVMDVTMPDLNGADAAQQILAAMPHVKVIALSMHSDKRFVAKMLHAGASGYLLKDCAFEELTSAIRSVMAGEYYLSPKLSGVLIKDYLRLISMTGSAAWNLTPREREIVQLLAEGHTTKEIASRLELSVKTVETHRQRVSEKLGIHSLAELTKFAIREGITSLTE